jgi:ribokinase
MGSGGVVVVGSFNVDQVFRVERFPHPGETCLGRFSSGPGGKGFNQAVSAVRQGAATAFIAAIGADALGEIAIELAGNERIDARWQRESATPTGTAAILLDAGAQNMIVVAPGANAALSVAHVEAQRALIEAAGVLLTQHEVDAEATAQAQRIARAAGVTCLHNPAPPRADCAQLVDAADILTPNETEFAALLAVRGVMVDAATLALLPDAALHDHCRALGLPTVVLTLGEHGAFVSHADPQRFGDDAPCYRVAARTVEAVDSTGAGDAFNGALAAHLALQPHAPLRVAADHAAAVAALAVERPGAALAMPRADEVRARFGA